MTCSKKEITHIVQQAQQGNREAMGQLYTACHDSLRKLCLHYVPNEATADDLLHDSFLLIYSRLNQLRDAAKAETWMHSIVRNVCLLYLRDKKQQPTVSLNESNVINTAYTTEPSAMTYDEIISLVDLLPEGYRQVFRLSVLEGMSHQQVATLLHIEPHSSSSQLYRAKQALRRLLRSLAVVLLVALLPVTILLLRDTSSTLKPSAGRVAHKSVLHTADKPTVATDPEENTYTLTKLTSATKHSEAQHTTQDEALCTEEQHDTLQTPVHKTQLAQQSTGDMPQHPSQQLVKQRLDNDSRWTLALAYSGISNRNDRQLPYADHNTNPSVYDSITHHKMPLTLSLSLNYRINSHWQVGTGMEYSRLNTDSRLGNSFSSQHKKQRVQYLGIPITLSWNKRLTGHFNLYSTVGATMQLPLQSTAESVFLLNGNAFEPTTERLHPGLQWSLHFGVGAEYQITPHIGIYAEPRLQHFFGNGSGVETWNTQHPVTFSLPVGVRLTW